MSVKNFLSVLMAGGFVISLAACGGDAPVDVQATVESAVQATVAALPAAPPTLVMGPGSGRMFDDFNYAGPTDPNLVKHDWTARAESGGPGIPGATWSLNGVSFPDDPDQAGNRLMQLSASTDGTPQQTRQA